METVLTTHHLAKKYGRLEAVKDLNLQVEKGTVYGILGPNGSGKTTTLGMLLGITNPTRGTFEWFGKPPVPESRRRIGALLEQPNFYPFLTAKENLKIVCRIKEVSYSRIPEVLNFVDLSSWENERFKTFSTGMKQRLALASAILNDPDVLILDEPTNGLDPQGIAEVRELIKSLANNERTILLASHLLDEVEKVCTHVTVLKNGELLSSGHVNEVVSQAPSMELAASDMEHLRSILEKLDFVNSIEEEKQKFVITVNDNIQPEDLNKALFEEGVTVSYLALRKPNLEQQFLELTR